MPRQARFVVADCPHHVVARGVNGCLLFRGAGDKRDYMQKFARIAVEEHVRVHAYCLMDNHVHFVLTPEDPDGLARLFHRLHTSWAMRFNRIMERTGHLFQCRYHSTPLDEAHFWAAVRYVELNPRRAGLLYAVDQWKYSSAMAHMHGVADPFVTLDDERFLTRFTPATWTAHLNGTDTIGEEEERLRRTMPGNLPCGSPEWVTGFEQVARRKLGWRTRGRPPGSKTFRPKVNTGAAH